MRMLSGAGRASMSVVAVGFVLVAVACGGSSSSVEAANSAPDGGTSDGGPDGGSTSTYTLDDVCEKTAPKTCALRKPCCEKTSAYDDAGCLANAKAECAKDVADARAGKATFHPERIDGCFAKLAPFFDTCSVTFDVLASVAKVLADCRIFEGSVGIGSACTRDGECAPISGAGFPSCSDTTKTCNGVFFLSAGAACSFAEPMTGFCDDGLFCDANLAAKPPAGTCGQATPVGKPCDAAKVVDLQCGLGNYCEKSTGLCAKGKGANAPCELDFECASFKCIAGVAGKRCAPPDDLVKPAECGKP